MYCEQTGDICEETGMHCLQTGMHYELMGMYCEKTDDFCEQTDNICDLMFKFYFGRLMIKQFLVEKDAELRAGCRNVGCELIYTSLMASLR